MALNEETVFVGVDIGSVNRPGGFSWVVLDEGGRRLAQGENDPAALVAAIGTECDRGASVAIAFESPLSVPVPALGTAGDSPPSWKALGKGRAGDGNRPWSAGAGAGALATGLVQAAWVCAALRQRIPGLRVTTQPERFRAGGRRLLLAEAMVTGAGKPEFVVGGQDRADAMAAAQRLRELVCTGGPSDVRCDPHRPLNLAAAAALHAGLAIDLDELGLEVLVAKAQPVVMHGAPR